MFCLVFLSLEEVGEGEGETEGRAWVSLKKIERGVFRVFFLLWTFAPFCCFILGRRYWCETFKELT